MKFSSPLRSVSLAISLWPLASVSLFAQDTTPPVVLAPLADITVAAGSSPTVIKLKKTFGLQGITGKTVRFMTNVGTIDVALLADSAPNTVAAFLGYANVTSDNNAGVPTYTDTLIQRAVPGFIVQGGGFYINNSGQFAGITDRPAIPGEAGSTEATVHNTRGTLAMALSNGPDSAVGDFFFNIADNTGDNPNAAGNLDNTSDGGPFTVFGRVVAGLSVLDAIAALPQSDSSSTLGASFSNIPLFNYDSSSSPTIANLVVTNSITTVPLVPKSADGASVLTLSVKSSSDLVNAQIVGQKLYLTYAAGQTGAAKITVKAKNPSTKAKAKASFTVTVQ